MGAGKVGFQKLRQAFWPDFLSFCWANFWFCKSARKAVKSPCCSQKWEAVMVFRSCEFAIQKFQKPTTSARRLGTACVAFFFGVMAQGHSAKVHVATHQRRAQGRSAAATDQGQGGHDRVAPFAGMLKGKMTHFPCCLKMGRMWALPTWMVTNWMVKCFIEE